MQFKLKKQPNQKYVLFIVNCDQIEHFFFFFKSIAADESMTDFHANKYKFG